MKYFVRLIAICAAGIFSVQAQPTSQVSQTSVQPKDVRRPEFTISNPNANNTAIAFSANGLLLAAAFEHVIQIYDVHQGYPLSVKPSQTLAGAATHALTFLDSNILVSLATDGSVKTWDATSGKMLHRTSLDSGVFTVSAFATRNQPVLAT